MDLKKINEIDIKDLAKFFKEINFQQIRAHFQERPAAFINVILILLTGTLSFWFFQEKTHEGGENKQKLNKLQEKFEVVDAYRKIRLEEIKFKANFPESLTVQGLIEKLSELANAHHVQITTLSPTKERSEEFIQIATMRIHVSANNYESMLAFTEGLEKLPFAIRLQHWTGQSSGENQKFETDIELNAFRLKK